MPGEPASPVGCDGAASALRPGREGDSGSFVWLHFSLANAASERWLRQNLSLPGEFHASLHEPIGSTRLEQDGDSLVAVIHDVMFDFTVDTADVSTVALCVEPRILVSARPRPLRSLDRLRGIGEGGAGLPLAGGVAGAPAARPGSRPGRHRPQVDAPGGSDGRQAAGQPGFVQPVRAWLAPPGAGAAATAARAGTGGAVCC